jgi:hypothetical protein
MRLWGLNVLLLLLVLMLVVFLLTELRVGQYEALTYSTVFENSMWGMEALPISLTLLA